MFSWYVLNVKPIFNYFCAFTAFIILLPNMFFSDKIPTRMDPRIALLVSENLETTEVRRG